MSRQGALQARGAGGCPGRVVIHAYPTLSAAAQDDEISALRAQIDGLREFQLQKSDLTLELAAVKGRLDQAVASHHKSLAAIRQKQSDARVRRRRVRRREGAPWFLTVAHVVYSYDCRPTFNASSMCWQAQPTPKPRGAGVGVAPRGPMFVCTHLSRAPCRMQCHGRKGP